MGSCLLCGRGDVPDEQMKRVQIRDWKGNWGDPRWMCDDCIRFRGQVVRLAPEGAAVP